MAFEVELGVSVNTESIKTQISGVKVEPIKVTLDTSSVKDQIGEIQRQIKNLSGTTINLGGRGVGGTGRVSGVKQVASELREVQSLTKKIGNLDLRIGKINTKSSSSQIKDLERQLQSLMTQYEATKQSLSGKGSGSTPPKELIEAGRQIDQLKIKIDSAKKTFMSGVGQNFSGYDAQIESLTTRFEKLSRKSSEVTNSMGNVKQALADMKAATTYDDFVEAENRYLRALKQTEAQLRKNEAIERQQSNADNFAIAKEKAMLRLKGLFEKNSEAARRFGADVQSLQRELNECGNTTGVEKVGKKISNLAMKVEQSGLQTKTLGTRLKEQFNKYKDYLSVASVFMYVTQAMKSMFDQVVAIDSAMTELKKVTNETDTSYDQFLNNAASRAKEIGTTIDGLVSSTADFAKLGYSFEESQGLAEVANIYAVVGDEIDGVEGATESLVSTLSAFKDEMGDMSDTDFAMSIVDKFNEVANRYSISSGGIGEALQRSASSMAAANNTLDETIALITAANTVVQDPDAVGTAFKTISMRIRGAKTELEEAGLETEGMVESTSKLREEIMALTGVDIMESEDQFKSTYQIMDELASKWQNLSDIQQATVTELIAGKRQGNIVSSLMSNFDLAREALETSMNSSGSAMKEHAKWSDSLEARLLKLKSTWQSLSQSFMSSDFLKVVISSLTGLVDIIDTLVNKIGVIPTLLTGGTLFSSLFGKENTFGIFKTFNTDLDGFINKAGILSKSFAEISNAFNDGRSKNGGGLKGFFGGLSSVGNIFKYELSDMDIANIQAYNELIKQGATGQTAWNQTMLSSSAAAQNLVASANGGEVALQGLTSAATTSTAAMVGLKVAMGLLNMGLTLLISAAISWGIKKFDEMHESAEELAEKVEEVTSKYKTQHDELMKLKGDYDTTNEDSMISKYGELSKGVDSLGENISLTADEYAEYQNIVSKIANQNPDLVKGYNSQGDAILECAGDINKLSDAYKQLIRDQNDEVLESGEDIFKDFQNDLKNTTAHYQTQETVADGVNYETTKNVDHFDFKHFDELEKLMNLSGDELESYVSKLDTEEASRISDLLEEYGIKRDKVFDDALDDGSLNNESQREHIVRALGKDRKEVKKVLDDAREDINAYAEDMGTVTEAFFSTAFLGGNGDGIGNYSHLSEKMQNIITQATSGLDAEFYADFLKKEDPYKELTKYYTNLLDIFNNLSNADAVNFEAAFNLKTQFNSGDISYGEYVKGVQDAENFVDGLGLDEEFSAQIKLALNTKEVTDNYDALKERLTSDEYNIQMKTDEAEKFLSGLSASEYSVAIDLITNGKVNFNDFDIKSLREYIEKQAKLNEAMNFTIAIDVEKESIETLNTAMAESVSGAGLSSEAITALKSRYSDLASEGYDLSAMFEETSNGIHLNKRAVDELEQAYASDKLKETDSQLGVLKDRYDELTEKIKNCTDAGERASLYNEQQSIAQKINDLATLASQYQGLTSAYNKWISAEESGNERDMYENIISGFKTVEDEISRGWVDDGTIKFLELMTGRTDLATLSAKELKKVYKGLDKEIKNTGYSVKDFFTTDDEGNSTSTGVYNFLRAVESLESDKAFKNLKGIEKLVERNEDGKITAFDFKVAGGDKAIADALGISEELVQIMQRAADDAGFVVTLEGKWTQLADLKTSAETANNTLKKLKKEGLDSLKNTDLNFDFDANNLQSLNKELEKSIKVLDKFKDKNGQIKKDSKGNYVEGAQEALEIASYFTATIDKLTEPVYMQLETNQVEKDLQEPLKKMQEFERLSKEKHQIQLTGDTKELEKVNKEMEGIAKWLEGLDEDAKVDIGIDGLDYKEIQKKLEAGEIEIPATVDIQMEMSEDIKDMRLLMMNQIGLISDEEVKLKIGYDIDDSVVNKLSDKEQEVVVKFVTKTAENEKWFKSLSEEHKEILIELITSGVNLDSLNYDKKKVFIEFVSKNEKWFNSLTDDRKEIIVSLVGSGVNLDVLDDKQKNIVINYIEKNRTLFDSLSDEEKKVVVKYVAEGKDFDKLTNEEKKIIVKLIGDDSELKDWTPEQKEAMVKYIVDGGNVEKWTPEQKKAWAQYLVDHGDIDGWSPEMKQAWAQYLVDGGDVEGWTPEMKEAYAKYIVDGGDVEGWTLEDKKAFAKYLVDGGDVEGWTPPVKPGEASYTPSLASTFLPAITGLTAWYTPKIKGGGVANGTANANGTAFANGTTGRAFKQGNWSTKDSGVALMGELGPETIVRDGRFFTVGDEGAGFYKYKKGDIIFNHKQTEELFKNGKVTSGGGRGRALASGTAFAFPNNKFANNLRDDALSVVNPSLPGGDGTGGDEDDDQPKKKPSGGSAEKEAKETIDWIEKKIDRIERAIDQLDKKANSVYRKWSVRNESLADEISKVQDEIELQQKAYDRYIQEADSVGLDEAYAEKVRNGTIDIEKIYDEDLAEKIKNYTEWYEKALDCKDAILDLKETESELYAQRFEHVQKQYDGILQGYEHTEAMLNEYISQAEEQGFIVSKKYYQALIDNEKSNIAELKKQQADLIAARDEAVESGAIAKGSEAWLEQCAAIDEVTQAIEESTTSLLEFDNAMREIDFGIFDLIQERISAVSEEADFLIELMSNEKLFDDDGKLTSQGLATMGLHAQNANSYMYQADEYGAEVAKLDAQIKKDPYDQELINRRNELLELQRESILNAEDEKNAIKDLVEEGISLELDALQERIDKYNESIDAAKDLYDYQKDVQEQSEEIASLEKQRAAYLNDDSEESKKKLQEINVSLKEAKEDLQETEYERYIDDQQKLLDELYNEYEIILNTRLDNIDYLLEQVIESVNAAAGSDSILASALSSEGAIAIAVSDNATSIKTTLESEAKNVGTTLSNAMNSIWSTGDGNAKSVLTMYGEDFRTKSATIITTLNGIKTGVNNMVASLNKEATKKVSANKTSTSAKKDPTKTTTTKKTATKKSSGDGKPKIGDRVKYVSGQYYYDSQGKKPLGSHKKGEYVYITNINTKDWATHGYHISTGKKLGSGDLGWLKLSQISGYATGKKNFLDDEAAWTQEDGQEYIIRPSDGAILTPIARGDSVLTSSASSNIWSMANNPAEFIKDNLGIGSANAPSNSNVQNNYTQNLDKVVFNLPNVKNYDEFLSAMQKDKNFQRLIESMTIDGIAGKSSLTKGKAIR